MAKMAPIGVLKAYGRRLLQARKAAGVTQAEVARALDCQQPFVSKAERGQMMLRPFDYPTVASLLDVSIMDLIGPLTDEEKRQVEEFDREAEADWDPGDWQGGAR